MFTCIVGIVSLLALVALIGKFVYQHFVLDTNLAPYGAKSDAWAVITGASEGIGRGFAIALAKKGFNIAIVARRESVLREVAEVADKAGVKSKIITLDCGKENAVAELVQAVQGLKVTVLVNNVGVNTRYPETLVDTTDEDIDNMININISFTTKLTRAFVPILTKNKKSLIFNLSSYTGRVPIAMMAVYSATKSYVDVFSRSLSAELAQQGVDVISVLPHYVVSAMSGIKRANWSTPDGPAFAFSTLKQIGSGAYSIAPHWFHDLVTIITSVLPEAVVGKMSLSKMQVVRKKLIARDARNAAKTA